ncbi:TonB-dependent receptor plug domain-containing protein [Gluconacetobacter sacchari]|uniref:TonB-dependent receptor plug domain-containing protein n=1 Tax=Gluconacetobacter sacchari TaxID=92759 RepID=UPI0039B6B04D
MCYVITYCDFFVTGETPIQHQTARHGVLILKPLSVGWHKDGTFMMDKTLPFRFVSVLILETLVPKNLFSATRVTVLLGATMLATGTAHAAAPNVATPAKPHKVAHSSGVRRSRVQGAPARTIAPASVTATGAVVTNAAVSPVADRTATLRNVTNAGNGADNSESIVVTGSALRSGRYNPNPVQIVSSEAIQQTSATNLGDYLQRLPSIGSNGTSNTYQNGGDGMSCADIRNLGQSRVLILIDGKRMVQTMAAGFSCANLNNIPTDMIDSVEILKDGGSELYGADAVSGVINVKLKHNIQGGTITARGGITDVGDDKTGKLSGIYGFNFDHGKGNITLSGQYLTQEGVMQKDRGYLSNPLTQNTAIGASNVYGSGYSASSRIFGDNTPGGGVVPDGNGGYRPFTSADRYNYGAVSSLLTYLQQSNLGGDAHYDVNSHLTLYANVWYTHEAANTQLAGMPVSGSVYPSTLSNPLALPENAPYYSSSWGDDAYMYRRYTDVGNRENNTASDTYQFTAGAKGTIVGKWEYDVSMGYGSSQATFNTNNELNYRKLLQTYGIRQLDPSDAGSAVTYDPTICQMSAGCVLSNPADPLSPAAANYVRFNEHNHADYQLRDFNARVHNDQVVKLPYKNGGYFGLAGGIEHRSEQASYHADPLDISGDSAGNSSQNTGGGFNATEVYLEGKMTLLHNAFLAKNLLVDAQGRWSRYNTFGSTQTWKASIDWAPVQDISFSATLGTSFRQPSVTELYGGQGISYDSAIDPCSQASSYGAAAANVMAYCSKMGINTATFEQPNSQIPIVTGGNAKVSPETARTYTIGTVLTPRWTPGLRIGVTYWHYTLKNMISTLPTQYIVDACATGESSYECQFINPRNTANQLTTVENVYQNVGGLRTSGIDFDLTYRLRLGLHDVLTLNNNFQQLVSYLQQNEPGGAWNNYAGRLFYQGYGSGQPRVRDYATAAWTHDRFTFTYMMSYTGGMKWNDGTNDVSCQQFYYCKTPGIFTHDVSVSYHQGRWNVMGGVNNILDKKAPFVADGTTNTSAQNYGELIIGRYVYLQAGVNF